MNDIFKEACKTKQIIRRINEKQNGFSTLSSIILNDIPNAECFGADYKTSEIGIVLNDTTFANYALFNPCINKWLESLGVDDKNNIMMLYDILIYNGTTCKLKF